MLRPLQDSSAPADVVDEQKTAELIRRGMTIAPTLEIRPGYPFNVMVTQDVVFPGPYDDARLP